MTLFSYLSMNCSLFYFGNLKCKCSDQEKGTGYQDIVYILCGKLSFVGVRKVRLFTVLRYPESFLY